MHELLAAVAHWLNVILPDAFQLPSLTFVLPHGVYWLGLILFPFLAMYMVRRAEQRWPPKSAQRRCVQRLADGEAVLGRGHRGD